MRAIGVRRKVAVAVVVALGFYTLSDILLWQRIFEAHQLWAFDGAYQTGHVAILVGIIAVGAVLLLDTGLWALWFGGALYTLAFGGVADVLHYWLDGRPLPAVLPWLDPSRLIFVRPTDGDVTSFEVLASAAFWLALWLTVLFAAPPQLSRIAASRSTRSWRRMRTHPSTRPRCSPRQCRAGWPPTGGRLSRGRAA